VAACLVTGGRATGFPKWRALCARCAAEISHRYRQGFGKSWPISTSTRAHRLSSGRMEPRGPSRMCSSNSGWSRVFQGGAVNAPLDLGTISRVVKRSVTLLGRLWRFRTPSEGHFPRAAPPVLREMFSEQFPMRSNAPPKLRCRNGFRPGPRSPARCMA